MYILPRYIWRKYYWTDIRLLGACMDLHSVKLWTFTQGGVVAIDLFPCHPTSPPRVAQLDQFDIVKCICIVIYPNFSNWAKKNPATGRDTLSPHFWFQVFYYFYSWRGYILFKYDPLFRFLVFLRGLLRWCHRIGMCNRLGRRKVRERQ